MASKAPQTVAYCHCKSCRRWTGAPVAAFAAFAPKYLRFEPGLGAPFSSVPGVERWTCQRCHAPLAAAFDYLPKQIYVPLGLFDDIDQLPPEMHCHHGEKARWLNINDQVPRSESSARCTLSAAREQ